MTPAQPAFGLGVGFTATLVTWLCGLIITARLSQGHAVLALLVLGLWHVGIPDLLNTELLADSSATAVCSPWENLQHWG